MAACKGERGKALLFTQAGFYSHYFGDFFLSGWPLGYWFPFQMTTYTFAGALDLGSPVNYALCAAAVLLFAYTGWRFHRTPFEVLSPRLDARVCNLLFCRKELSCATCSQPANEICIACGQPVCVRHAPVDWSFEPRCERCRRGPA